MRSRCRFALGDTSSRTSDSCIFRFLCPPDPLETFPPLTAMGTKTGPRSFLSIAVAVGLPLRYIDRLGQTRRPPPTDEDLFWGWGIFEADCVHIGRFHRQARARRPPQRTRDSGFAHPVLAYFNLAVGCGGVGLLLHASGSGDRHVDPDDLQFQRTETETVIMWWWRWRWQQGIPDTAEEAVVPPPAREGGPGLEALGSIDDEDALQAGAHSAVQEPWPARGQARCAAPSAWRRFAARRRWQARRSRQRGDRRTRHRFSPSVPRPQVHASWASRPGQARRTWTPKGRARRSAVRVPVAPPPGWCYASHGASLCSRACSLELAAGGASRRSTNRW